MIKVTHHQAFSIPLLNLGIAITDSTKEATHVQLNLEIPKSRSWTSSAGAAHCVPPKLPAQPPAPPSTPIRKMTRMSSPVGSGETAWPAHAL